MLKFNSGDQQDLLEGSMKGNRLSQRLLYERFYGYGMKICLRYTRSREEAKNILNQGFFNVFTMRERFDSITSFKSRLSEIIINTAIGYYKQQIKSDVDERPEVETALLVDEYILNGLSHEDLILLIQKLSFSQRFVFNLYVIEGFTHLEVANVLGISIEMSQSILSYSREKLRETLATIQPYNYE
jgi:RNA polymerase sigma factor (sigma-70 family)